MYSHCTIHKATNINKFTWACNWTWETGFGVKQKSQTFLLPISAMSSSGISHLTAVPRWEISYLWCGSWDRNNCSRPLILRRLVTILRRDSAGTRPQASSCAEGGTARDHPRRGDWQKPLQWWRVAASDLQGLEGDWAWSTVHRKEATGNSSWIFPAVGTDASLLTRPAVSGVCCLPGAQVLHVLQQLQRLTQPLRYPLSCHPGGS